MMRWLTKKKQPIPFDPETQEPVIRASICTGERTIGFYDKKTRRLRYAELVRTDADITRFYRQYGLIRDADPETLH